MRIFPGMILGLLAAPALAQAEPSCRQALVLGLDVSGSVDRHEYRLQLDGLAAALQSPDVKEALLQFPSAPVSISVFEWSGKGQHRLVLPWASISTPAALSDVTATLRATKRQLKSQATAVGDALREGGKLLAMRPNCWTRTIDLSGDGISNEGPGPKEVEDHPLLDGVTVNALVVGSEQQDEVAKLSAYFQAAVIKGTGAFVEVAFGYDDYQSAMTRKLLRELSGLNVAQNTLP